MLKNKIEVILNKEELEKGIYKYLFIINRVNCCDVSKDLEFQRVYKNFFAMGRKNQNFYKIYFELMESLKTQERTFEDLLHIIHEKTGEYHCSFISKMIAVLKVDEPIWDKVVAEKHFGYRLPYPQAKNREERIIKLFSEYRNSYLEFVASEEALEMIKAFDRKFPSVDISDVKKIDFILWQDRAMK